MFKERIVFFSSLVLVVFFVFIARLVYLQIIQGDKFLVASESNRLRILKTPAPRGIIYDRNEIPLVKNIPTFSVSIVPEDLKRLNIEELAEFLKIKPQDILDKLNRKDVSPFVPIKLKTELTMDEISVVEARRSDFQGLFIETEVGREYLFGKTGAHVIGYLGKITPAQLNNRELMHFPPDALIGQWGVEALFDSKLRGQPGEKIVEVDALGRELRLIQKKPAIKGEDVHLTIDINVMKAIDDAFGSKAGALVAIDPNNGEILALESLPSFDPNAFAHGIKYLNWKELIEDKKKPMLNRAIQSQYPPGSTFKIVTALAALQEGVISPETKVTCTGGIGYGSWTFGCWKKGGHGIVDFYRGLVESCDVYYYELGKRLGIDKIKHYAQILGLNRETGIHLPPLKESKGLIPSTEWKKEKKKSPWFLGDTFISAIGQGFVLATPIQMAKMIAAVANGKRSYKPTLIKGNHQIDTELDFDTKNLELVRKALHGVVHDPAGTGKNARSAYCTVSGKTGTAQVVSKKKGAVAEKFTDHAWFVAYAPSDNPQIALAVFVEHGGGGGAVAAPIATRAIDAFFNKDSNLTPKESESASD